MSRAFLATELLAKYPKHYLSLIEIEAFQGCFDTLTEDFSWAKTEAKNLIVDACEDLTLLSFIQSCRVATTVVGTRTVRKRWTCDFVAHEADSDYDIYRRDCQIDALAGDVISVKRGEKIPARYTDVEQTYTIRAGHQAGFWCPECCLVACVESETPFGKDVWRNKLISEHNVWGYHQVVPYINSDDRRHDEPEARGVPIYEQSKGVMQYGHVQFHTECPMWFRPDEGSWEFADPRTCWYIGADHNNGKTCEIFDGTYINVIADWKPTGPVNIKYDGDFDLPLIHRVINHFGRRAEVARRSKATKFILPPPRGVSGRDIECCRFSRSTTA
jgi:hypothetical protein